MSRSWTATAIQQELFKSQSGMCLPFLIQISHASWNSGTPYYFVNNTESVTYDGNTYLPFPFSFDPPDETDSGITNARLTIDAVDQSIIEMIRTVPSAPTVTIIAAYIYDTIEELVPWTFTFRNVQYQAETVSGELIYEDRLQNQLSPISISARSFPGLF